MVDFGRTGGGMVRSTAVQRCLLVVVVLAACLLQAAGSGGQIVDEEMTEEQINYYRTVLETYDTNHDGLISMDENLEQDKIIAEESGKPFDEVQPRKPACTTPAVPSSQLSPRHSCML